jgi:hypothetical protein
MNRVLVGAVVGIMAVLGLLVCPGTSGWAEDEEAKITFENTKVGTVPDGCTIAETGGTGTKATWKVIEMEGAPSGKRVLAITETKNKGNTFNLAYAEESNFKDFEISVRIKPLSGEEDRGGGLVWRLKNPDNYYIARWNPLEENFRVYYVKDGQRHQLASTALNADQDKWHEISIEMMGNKITAEFDEDELIEIEDGTFTEGGKVGVWTKADAASAFDDFTVEIKKHDKDNDKDDDDDDDKK